MLEMSPLFEILKKQKEHYGKVDCAMSLPSGQKVFIAIENAADMTSFEFECEVNWQVYDGVVKLYPREGPSMVKVVLCVEAWKKKQELMLVPPLDETALMNTALVPLEEMVGLELADRKHGCPEMAGNVSARFYEFEVAFCHSLLDTPTGGKYRSVCDMNINDYRKSAEEAAGEMRERLQALFKEEMGSPFFDWA